MSVITCSDKLIILVIGEVISLVLWILWQMDR